MDDLDHLWGSCNGPLAVCRYYQERSLQELRGVIRGLEHIHRKMVIHGDLKAANVAVESSGEVAIAKIIDFGSSKLQCWCFTGQNDQCGTMLWDSPELFEDEPRTPSSDIWAFGCLALEVQMGLYPYAGDSCEDMDIRRLVMLQARGDLPATESDLDLENKPISRSVWEVIQKCWEFEPCDRPSSPELVKLLERIQPAMTRDHTLHDSGPQSLPASSTVAAC